MIAVSFLPVLTLEAQEGRLFKPLAYTKNLAMIVAAFLAITLDPALRRFSSACETSSSAGWLCRIANAVLVGKIHSEEKHPISRLLMRIYEPVVGWTLRWKWVVIGGARGLIAVTVPVYLKLGSNSCRPWTRARCSTCRRRCRVFRSARRSGCCR